MHVLRAAVESGEFDTVDGLQIQGCDFVHTRADGLIDAITVMLRPLKAVSVFAHKMRMELDNAGTG